MLRRDLSNGKEAARPGAWTSRAVPAGRALGDYQGRIQRHRLGDDDLFGHDQAAIAIGQGVGDQATCFNNGAIGPLDQR